MGAAISNLMRRPAPPALPAAPKPPGAKATISKKAIKKAARQKRLEERKQARKAERRAAQAVKKAQRREERLAKVENLPECEQQKLQEERVAQFRAGRALERAKRAELKDILRTKTRYTVCIDLGWNEEMMEKERKSLARQLAYSYSALRKGVEEGLTPIRLAITGVDEVIKPVMDFVAKGWESWPVKLEGGGWEDVFERRRIVYLTHDAEDVLEELDERDVYVVGGIVDRNRLKGVTVDKARRMGVRVAKFNLGDVVELLHGSPVLTVNHCVEILLYRANGMSWKEAYMKVLPVRKGVREATEREMQC